MADGAIRRDWGGNIRSLNRHIYLRKLETTKMRRLDGSEYQQDGCAKVWE
jgi:hypothetical protein